MCAIPLNRCTRSLTSSSYSLSRIASLLAIDAAPTRRSSRILLCSRCYSQQRLQQRKLSTATEYKPYTLDSAPPPPRNANIPDTSVAGTMPEVNDTRPPQIPAEQTDDIISLASPQQRASTSLPERDAQISQPVSKPLPTPPHQPTKRTTKLRPRKAAMVLTPKATIQLRALLDQPEPKLIRVGVKNRGCSGLAYHLEYVDKPGMFDESVEQDGVKVLVDSKALFSIIGSEMDWVEDKLEQRFVFRNPNISRWHLQ